MIENIDFMISSKDISASQRLKSSLDIFFLLGILLRNSAALEVFHNLFFAGLRMPLGPLEYFDLYPQYT